MCCKSLIYVLNTDAAVITEGSIIPFKEVIRRYGSQCRLVNNQLRIQGGGYYDVWASVTVSATAEGPITLRMQQDGVDVPGAIDTENVATAGDVVTLQVKAPVRVEGGCPRSTSVITFVLSENATLQEASAEIEKK